MKIRLLLLAALVVLGSSQAALAATTTLICDVPHSDRVITDGVPTIDLNEAEGTVTIHYAAWRSVNGGSQFPEKTIGPIPAEFGLDIITIPPVERPGWSIEQPVTLSRVTGFWSLNSWTCHAAKKQF